MRWPLCTHRQGDSPDRCTHSFGSTTARVCPHVGVSPLGASLLSSISFATILHAARSRGAGETNPDMAVRDDSGFNDQGTGIQISERWISITFWLLGLLLAVVQSWSHRNYVTADAIQYLDMSDGVSPISNWHRLINGIWSPLYPFLLGLGRVLHPTGYQEIVTAHFFNIAIFVFAFGSFEFFQRSLIRDAESSEHPSVPRWVFLTIGYTIFLWVSVTQITFESLRPDMLMSAFVYLAMGILVRVRQGGATWVNFVALGVILGVSYLGKAPMLVIGMAILACTLTQWRQTMAKAIAAGILMLAIGSLYFIPLSKQLGHFSLGESSTYNYLYHVNQASPTWYLDNPGTGTGRFWRSPTKIYNSPPAYEFHYGQVVTHSLRFDPVYWTVGAKPRFTPSGQFWAVVENSKLYREILEDAGGIVAGLLVLLLICGPGWNAARDAARHWPVCMVGLLGLLMYVAVHLENRYSGVFFALLWLGLLAGIRLRGEVSKRVVPAVAVGIALSILGPMTVQVGCKFLNEVRKNYPDPDIEAAVQLKRLGLTPGSPVARISFAVTDLAWARLSKASVVAEVDFERADEFWTAGQKAQDEVLQAFAKTGAKLVVAHPRGSTAAPPPGWQRLGRSRYWIHWLS
jgi:hypothetical protein